VDNARLRIAETDMSSNPPLAANARDLTDAEFADLDELLAQTPEPLQPCDAVMLDGYLCGVLVQPMLVAADDWLPNVFDFEGRPLPDDVDAEWLDRTRALILRRHAALTRSMAEDGWFDPLVLEFDDDEPPPTDESVAQLHPISQALMPWVAGFQHATVCFPALADMPDDAVMGALARLYRHLPAETPEEKEIVATLDREQPLTTLEDAIGEMVLAVADLSDLTRDLRYKVDTIKRDTPKVGRNDPCPCGSGKKFKHCHGA
jgi:uncharacterized protein